MDLRGGVDLDISDLILTNLYMELDIAIFADVSVTPQAGVTYVMALWCYTSSQHGECDPFRSRTANDT